MTKDEAVKKMEEASEALIKWREEDPENRCFMLYMGDASIEEYVNVIRSTEYGDSEQLYNLLDAVLDDEETFITSSLEDEDECDDSWFGKDKLLHFLICVVASTICPLVGIGLAVFKEVYDAKTEGNHWCWKDLVADSLGVACGSLLYLMLH